ncbi:MAG: hypothetical protein WCG93_13655 [Paludibacter sp.]
MEFTEQRNQIIAQMKNGDRKAIAERAGVSRSTATNTLFKSSLSDMTDAEKKYWIAAVEYINERMNERMKDNSRIEKLTSKVAGRF